MIVELFLLLILFQVKHFLCDYPLQSRYMLRKTNSTGWFLSLLWHSTSHGIYTFVIVYLFNPQIALLCAFIDVSLHFIMDKIKSDKRLLNRFTPAEPYFWWALGFDQMFHHLTHYLIIYLTLTYGVL